jgi:hypothetical protein
MELKIPVRVLEHDIRAKLGITGYDGHVELDLSNLKSETIDHIQKTLTPHKKLRGITQVLRTIEAYHKLTKLEPDATCAKANRIEPYYLGMRKILAALPGKRLYKIQKDGLTPRADGYYIEAMSVTARRRYYDKYEKRYVTVPGYITLLLTHLDDNGLHRDNVNFDEDDCFGKHPFVMLANNGYTVETPELKAEMLATRKLWQETHKAIGLQLTAIGFAELRERDEDDDNNRWLRRNSYTLTQVRLDKDGPAHVVVDVKNEDEESGGDEDEAKAEKTLRSFGVDFWETEGKLSENESKLLEAIKKEQEAEAAKSKRKHTSDDDEDSDEDEDDSDLFEEDEIEEEEERPVAEGTGLVKDIRENIGPIAEVPVHPWLTCFDLRKHHHVRLHMSQTERYKYNPDLRNALVIDTASRMLIEMLLYQREQFKDVIAKKGGGAVILCAGPPGVGKTLTSEVFAETEKRPLYSVQCSQLGTHADALEKSLLTIFSRATRWNAILLLDEADVYIAKRGDNMNQNAIVGVFLRVLEYYNGVMFMTTNRAESVDDAILSRCVARIDYENPSAADQIKIWHILAKTSGLAIGAGVAENIAGRYSLSGRDVKQILKLAGLVAYARKLPAIDVATIEYCMRFKPTEKLDGTKSV